MKRPPDKNLILFVAHCQLYPCGIIGSLGQKMKIRFQFLPSLPIIPLRDNWFARAENENSFSISSLAANYNTMGVYKKTT
ncbi:MAG: hypothetical protein COY85_03165 [Candidatus Portnoybacteria bacterium CG_4_10_14_0_8_um_filter_40_50]|uniref:Uncharacterized protein n=1 Tax=Candidatus Portnoybacteria bacterium CG_4_10_14_0_8_um_filter_40_50 TaxID=1974800 RepID=A0A2M7QR20_9BACT|nr:MAG: hypothetical protein COY85_03165 [Candidatus Portnoybacteria bacterium CG_4_10_14_0_8_um_filter_40_50]